MLDPISINDDDPVLELVAVRGGVILSVRAHAGGRKNAIVGVREGMLRVAVTEAPEKGKANRAIIAVLSRELGLAKSAFELVAGDTSPRKRFLIVGADIEAIRAAIKQLGLDDA